MRHLTYTELEKLDFLELKKYQSELQDHGDEYDEADIDMIGDMIEERKYGKDFELQYEIGEL